MEEAYELADAAAARDDGRLLDELGDVLFQVYFLALLLEERGVGGLAAVADHCHAKLVRRHPHVFGEVEVAGADAVVRNWDEIKRGEKGPGGPFGDLPESLPATILARKVQRRVRGHDSESPAGDPLERVDRHRDRLASEDRDAREEAAGELLYAAVEVAAARGVDPELALRAAALRRVAAAAEDVDE